MVKTLIRPLPSQMCILASKSILVCMIPFFQFYLTTLEQPQSLLIFFLHKRCQSLFYTIQLWNCFSTRNVLIIKHRKHFSCVNILQTSWANATEVNDRSPTDLIEIRVRLLRNISRKIVLKRPMENNCLSCSQEFISMTSPDARQKAQLTAPPDVCFTRDSGNSGSLNFINTAVTAHWLLFCILNCWDGEWYQ